MHCLTCNTHNVEGARFCNACGGPLGVSCPHCFVHNPLGTRRCVGCDTDLVSQRGALASQSGVERRQLAVLFCDLVGSTELAGKLDLDDLRNVLRNYQDACTEIVSSHGGHVAQYLGDGILVYFGYPISHEDDSLRAVRAAGRIVERIAQLSRDFARAKGVELGVRIGIHTGLVVIGELGSGDRRDSLALGVVPNVAARIQAAAEPNTVVISAATHGLVAGLIECSEPRQRELQGVGETVALYRVIRETGVESRLAAAALTGLAPLVGRRAELERMVEAWGHAEKGERRTVLLLGEAGIGKSRQVHAFKEAIQARPKRVFECRCSVDQSASAFRPVLAAIERELLLTSSVAGDELKGLERAVTSVDLDPREIVPWIAPLLSLPLPESYEPPDVSPFKRRELTLAALLRLLIPPRARLPALLVIEDLHWADASTLELVSLASQDVACGAMLVLTARNSPDGLALDRAGVSIVPLDRMSREEATSLASRTAGGELAAPILESIVSKSDGVPLFVEELTKAEVERKSARPESIEPTSGTAEGSVPPSLRGLLAARLDRLHEAKQVAQFSSALGREFRFDILKAVSPWKESFLQEQLERLEGAGVLLPVTDPNGASFAFTHVLIRDAAYDSLLKASRKRYHAHIADVLTQEFPTLAHTRPELIAQHYQQAELPDRAIAHWQLAANRAIAASAYREAIGHLTQALGDVPLLESAGKRRDLERDLRSLLGTALVATEGYGSQAVKENVARAEELSQLKSSESLEPGADVERDFRAGWGLWAYHIVQAELDAAQRATDRLEALARHASRSDLMLESQVARGINLFYSGSDHTRALMELDAALGEYDDERHRDHAVRFGQDPKAVGAGYAAWILALQGRLNAAVERFRDGLAHASRRGHPFSEGYFVGHAAQLFYLLRDEPRCRELAERAMTIGTERGFPVWLANGGLYDCFSRAARGDASSALSDMQRHLGTFEWIQVFVFKPTRLELLSRIQESSGDLEAALATVTAAAMTADKSGELWCRAELERRSGELMLALGRPTHVVETSFRAALECARKQGALLFELRAASSLAALLEPKNRAEAKALLEPVFVRFAGELQIEDVRNAEQLLARLR
jgi:class 3 adenylate cyclase